MIFKICYLIDPFAEMYDGLDFSRDFTRFFDDQTFPHQVTVCLGDKRIFCSGALLAQQSTVLEKKFREDNGVLIFEELLDVNDSNSDNNNTDGIVECIRYLHGAELEFNMDTLPLVLKFASIYQIEELFCEASSWLANNIRWKTSETHYVETALNFLQVSKFLNEDHAAKLKMIISSSIRVNREVFGKECINLLDMKITGEDLILIISENPAYGDEILSKWASLSVENTHYIIENHNRINFNEVFPDKERFSSFIATLSTEAKTPDMFRNLLDLQKSFFESQEEIQKKQFESEKLKVAQEKDAVSSKQKLKKTKSAKFYTEESSEEECSDTQLYIGNLPPDADEAQIRRLFCGFGKVTDVKITSRKRGKNFGFITFAKSNSASKLLRRYETKDYELNGYELVIKMAHRKS